MRDGPEVMQSLDARRLPLAIGLFPFA